MIFALLDVSIRLRYVRIVFYHLLTFTTSDESSDEYTDFSAGQRFLSVRLRTRTALIAGLGAGDAESSAARQAVSVCQAAHAYCADCGSLCR